MRRDEACKILRKNLDDLHDEFGVAHISLFGSVARDEAGANSDVDVLVQFDKPQGLFGLIRLRERLEALLGCAVDVGTAESLKPGIREHVLSEVLRVA